MEKERERNTISAAWIVHLGSDLGKVLCFSTSCRGGKRAYQGANNSLCEFGVGWVRASGTPGARKQHNRLGSSREYAGSRCKYDILRNSGPKDIAGGAEAQAMKILLSS